MAQYTSTVTGFGGIVTNSVLNTVTNTQTITVTAPTGQAVTITVDAYDVNSNFDNIVSNLSRQLGEQGADVGLRGITQGLSQTTSNVSQQQQTATGIAVTTGNPPPAEKQAIPVSPTTDPEVNNAPPDPATEAPTPQVFADADQPTVTETPINNELEKPPGTDEFDGIDAQIEANENALPEPQQEIDPEEDPFEASRLEAEQNYDNNISASDSIIDDGSDPYVFNGETTITPIEQPNVDDGSDPYVSNGQSTIPQIENENPSDTTGATTRGLRAAAQSKATKDDATSFQKKPDWRVRLSLSPGANYLYKVGDGQAGILNPLQKTDGVIFPYTPAVSVTYTAGYDSSDIVHSNYKVFQYKGSSVDNLQITGDFTAQDTNEANYLLAVIHFFRSVTKMFYGQDKNPKNGVPPPLLYLSGLGTYQYDAHPLAITNFTYSLPTDVDYIRAGSQTNQPGQNLAGQQTPVNTNSLQQLRTVLNKLKPTSPAWSNQQSLINSDATYVPTKMQIQLTAVPIVTRNDISNNFSLEKYATGELLRGTKRSGGGIW